MPLCPICRKPVTSPFVVWCGCGTNLTKYDRLPNTLDDIKPWLEEYKPEILRAESYEGGILEQAKKSLIAEQEKVIKQNSEIGRRVALIKQTFQDFLAACAQEKLPPTSDVGRLRRERYRQQKKAGLTNNLPVRNFKPTPAYFFKITFGNLGEDFNLTLEGDLYRHHFGAPDPFPIEALMKIAPPAKITEGLRQALVEALVRKQTPQPEEPAKKKRFGRSNQA